MGGDFKDVVGGVGVGFGEEGDHDFVDLLGGIDEFGESGAVGFERVLETEKRFGDFARLRTGEADNADAAASGRGRDGDDGVVEHRTVSSFEFQVASGEYWWRHREKTKGPSTRAYALTLGFGNCRGQAKAPALREFGSFRVQSGEGVGTYILWRTREKQRVLRLGRAPSLRMTLF